MIKNLSERVRLLEEAGIDTSKYELKLGDVVLKAQDTEVANEIVENKQIENKTFRRYITAQTFKMLTQPICNKITKQEEYGWNAHLKHKYSYMYQFKCVLDEFKVLKNLERDNKEDFEERKQFYTKEVLIALCDDYFNRYVKSNLYEQNKFQILQSYYYEMKDSDSYNELYVLLKSFIKNAPKLDFFTPKCPIWKDTFKGSGAYYSLVNIVLYHGVKIHGKNKDESIQYLKDYALSLDSNNKWKLFNLLKEVIDENNFDLSKSIESLKEK